jgi:AI-2 transport protein TqsA
MNESSNNPAADKSNIAEDLTSTLWRPSFMRVMLVLAATVVVLVGIRLGAPILNPILFAVVFSLLFSPLYSWLRVRLPTGLALLLMLVVLIILFLGLFLILGASISKFSERVGFYATQLNGQLDSLDALLERLGLSNVDVRDVVKPSALAGALSAILSGISGFLSNLFLILMIMSFLLGEGPAMMNRLRASVSEDRQLLVRA